MKLCGIHNSLRKVEKRDDFTLVEGHKLGILKACLQRIKQKQPKH